jgi:two-component system, OmpR family, osmolarity sensor histidine kinase EnvZ
MLKLWHLALSDSLVGRLVLLVLTIGVLSFALHLTVMLIVISFISSDFAATTGTMIRHERTLLAGSPAAERNALASQLSDVRHRVNRLAATESKALFIPETFLTQGLLEKLRANVGEDIEVSFRKLASAPIGEAVFFEFTVDDERWQIVHEPGSPGLAAITGIVGWLALTALAVVVAASVGISLVNRPLRHLSSQLSDHAESKKLLTTPGNADREIRALVTSFNQLIETNTRAEEAKQQMLVGISHDLRTPLTRLRFRVEMACDEKAVAEIGRDLDALERIVTQFVGYAQSEGHVGYGDPWPVNEVISRIVATYIAQGVAVSFSGNEIAAALPDLAIQRALTNLIDNALEYGVAPIEVALTQSHTKGRRELRMTVWDCGAGMTESEFVLAVKPFSRLSSRNEVSGHCGLGLAIVSQIATQTGARLALDKADDHRFGVSLVWQEDSLELPFK